jgi:hypothetical protein
MAYSLVIGMLILVTISLIYIFFTYIPSNTDIPKTSTQYTIPLSKTRRPFSNRITTQCNVRRRLSSVPVFIGPLHHSGVMHITTNSDRYLTDYSRDGGKIQKIQQPISNNKIHDGKYEWVIDECTALYNDEYDIERVGEILYIITHGKEYDVFTHNCHDISNKISKIVLRGEI